MTLLTDAAAHLRAGRPVLLYDADDREAEVDLFYAAEHATPAAVRELRREAGGLVFLAVDHAVGRGLDLPFLQDVFTAAAAKHPVLDVAAVNDLRYDARSSFSLPINHRKTFTGITDRDRSLTITAFAELAAQAPKMTPEEGRAAFGAAFRSPGHVHLCVGAAGGLDERQGHTELGVALAHLAGVTPVLAGCEMLADDDGPRSVEAARAYAKERGTVLLDGAEVMDAWRAREKAPTPPGA